MIGPTLDDIFAVMSAASVGDTAARVTVPDDPPTDDPATNLAIALNLLLDDLAFRTSELEAAHQVSEEALERKVAERTLELAGVNQELESFSYSVAHDLRAPLRSISGFSQALLEDCQPRLDENCTRYLRFVRESAQQMAQLIDDLLTLARVTRDELKRNQVDLAQLAKAVLNRLATAEPHRMVDFIVPSQAAASGDNLLLGLVLENLIGNAWKFTAKHPRAHIEFGFSRGSEGPVYFVRDDGAGFDMAYAHKLFGVFQRLHSAKEFEGTGIGLATVRRIIRRHGGRVWAEGEVDRGATFYFTLEEVR